MKKRYAFMLMGEGYDPAVHRYSFDAGDHIVIFRTVRNFDEAKATAIELKGQGVGAIEVCGAFGREKARELIDATGGEVAIGYVVSDEDMGPLFAKFFG